MDKASDFGSEDCGFDSRRGRISFRTCRGGVLLDQKVSRCLGRCDRGDRLPGLPAAAEEIFLLFV